MIETSTQDQSRQRGPGLPLVAGAIVGAMDGATVVVVEVVAYALIQALIAAWETSGNPLLFGVYALGIILSVAVISPLMALISIPLGIIGIILGGFIGMILGALTGLVTVLDNLLAPRLQQLIAGLICGLWLGGVYHLVGYDLVAGLVAFLGAADWVAPINYPVSVGVGLWFGWSLHTLISSDRAEGDADMLASIREIGATILTPVLALTERRRKKKHRPDAPPYLAELEAALRQPGPFVIYRNLMYPREDLERLLLEAQAYQEKWS